MSVYLGSIDLEEALATQRELDLSLHVSDVSLSDSNFEHLKPLLSFMYKLGVAIKDENDRLSQKAVTE